MAVKEIILLGDARLYKACEALEITDLDEIKDVVADLHDTMMDFREKYQAGRAIAAPQIGYMKNLVYMNIDEPVVFINPVLSDFSEEMIELWDDCMSFPDLLVRLKRHRHCKISYRDLEWKEQSMDLSDDLSELLQHECDHLNGILATSHAIGPESFCLRSQKHLVQ